MLIFAFYWKSIFDHVQLTIFLFIDYNVDGISVNSLPKPRLQILSPMSSESFIALQVTFRSMIHLFKE